MARPKSLIVNMEFTTAGNSHNCRHNDSHRITKGTKRLTIKTDDGPQHYCLACAKSFIARDLERLQNLLTEVSASSS